MNPETHIVVVDYGAGNVQSVVNALDALGIPAELTSDAAVVRRADGIIVPGVGAAQDTITNLERRGLVEPVLDIIARDVPYLGICMGMQALMSSVGRERRPALPGRHPRRWPPLRDDAAGPAHGLEPGHADAPRRRTTRSSTTSPTAPSSTSSIPITARQPTPPTSWPRPTTTVPSPASSDAAT